MRIEHITPADVLLTEPPSQLTYIGLRRSVKGIVRRKLSWVIISINRQLLLYCLGAYI
jgi:hypothetical protein